MNIRHVPINGARLWVGDEPGEGAAIVLMHGIPDNHHLYDRVLPFLAGRHVVTFDFLGYGESDKPADHAYTAEAQEIELDRVITELGLDRVILVAHDASGPPGIDWAVAHPERVERLVLLNTYYSSMESLRAPEAVWLFSTPGVRPVARWISTRFDNWLFRRMYWWQVGRFFRDEATRNEYLPVLYEQFARKPSAQNAFFGINEDLRPTLRDRASRVAALREFERPVRIVFGGADPYLNAGVAREFAELFPSAELHVIPSARHFVQMDEPQRVAEEIMRN